MAQKKTVFLTGASGNMGHESFKQLYAKKNELNIVLLLRGSQKNKELFKAYENDPSVKIVWGDLCKYEDVLKCVTGADYVLHVGGMVSPSADYYPTKTVVTNTTAARNIVDAVKAQPDPDAIKVVYIGTVAETGDRNAPTIGDVPATPSRSAFTTTMHVARSLLRAFLQSQVLNIGYLSVSPAFSMPTSSRTWIPSCITFLLTVCLSGLPSRIPADL